MTSLLVFIAGLLVAEARLGVRALLSQNPHYPMAAASATCELAVFAVIISLPIWGLVRWRKSSMHLTAPAAALMWLLVFVPLPPSDFWSNGGTDDTLFLMPFLTLLMGPVCWVISARARATDLLSVIGQTALATSVILVSFALMVEGFDSKQRAARAFTSTMVTSGIAGVALLRARQLKRG